MWYTTIKISGCVTRKADFVKEMDFNLLNEPWIIVMNTAGKGETHAN
jgi:hypothetical protein